MAKKKGTKEAVFEMLSAVTPKQVQQAMKELLQGGVTAAQTQDPNVTERRSPLGIRELLVPASYIQPGAQATTSFGYGERAPVIRYNKKFANDPQVMNHERIHAGQDLTGQNLPVDLVARLLGYKRPDEAIGGSGLFAALEMPAYEFSIPYDNAKLQRHLSQEPTAKGKADLKNRFKGLQADQQQKLNRYLGMMNLRTANQAEPLEAAMPEELLRRFIQQYPAQVAPPKVIK